MMSRLVSFVTNLLFTEEEEDEESGSHNSADHHPPSTPQRSRIFPVVDDDPLDPACLEAQAHEKFLLHPYKKYGISAIQRLSEVSRLYMVESPITYYDKTDLVKKKFFLNGPNNYSIQNESGEEFYRVTFRNEFRITHREVRKKGKLELKMRRAYTARESYVVDNDGYLVMHFLRSILKNRAGNHLVLVDGLAIATLSSTNNSRLKFHALSELIYDDFNYQIASQQLKLFTLSRENPTFDIIDRCPQKHTVIGQIHSKWVEKPGVLGVEFPVTLSPRAKASLMMAALLVNDVWQTT